MTLVDLVIVCECGGSDGTSSLAGNPVIGEFFDLLVDAGGTAIFEETVEMLGLRHILAERASTPAAKGLVQAHDEAFRYCHPCGSIRLLPKTCSRKLRERLDHHRREEHGRLRQGRASSRPGRDSCGAAPPHRGLWLLDSVADAHYMQFGYMNPNDTEGIMDLISAGRVVGSLRDRPR